MIRLLISSAGRRVELIHCFRKAADLLRLELEIVAVDMNPAWSPACQVADKAYDVPACSEPIFFDEVLSICKHHKIDAIIPTIDTELLGYTINRDHFSSIGTKVLISAPGVIRIARDKGETASVLGQHGIGVPMTWCVNDVLAGRQNPQYPMIIKPKDGSASKGISIIENFTDLKNLSIESERYVLQELCCGKEFTVNCFYDSNGTCQACIPHYRQMVRAGEVCFAETVRVQEFRNIADGLSKIFPGIQGCICYQAFLGDDGGVKVFEINARFGGGYPICDFSGGTFAKWILQDLIGNVPDYHDSWTESVRMLRYDAAIFSNGEKTLEATGF
jgi:carbamoyl-phosphate synthase large subunit